MTKTLLLVTTLLACLSVHAFNTEDNTSDATLKLQGTKIIHNNRVTIQYPKIIISANGVNQTYAISANSNSSELCKLYGYSGQDTLSTFRKAVDDAYDRNAIIIKETDFYFESFSERIVTAILCTIQ